jgi:parallel beta-helix repeat protein
MLHLHWLMTLLVGLCVFASGNCAAREPESSNATLNRSELIVTDYLPRDFVTDGSISYQPLLQKALDEAAKSKRNIIFPPIVYRLDNPTGLRLHSSMTLHMHGATFLLAETCHEDGQAFLGEQVTDVQFLGGEIRGRNDEWPLGINIAGIRLTGPCERIRIRDMHIRDLSSNGVGLFATSEQPARDVWLCDTIIQYCCNYYGDYTAPAGVPRGPEKGSTRQDQGLVAFYHVRDFVVRGCRFEDSRSDGTHFFRCTSGQFVDNKVYRAKMGGYFLESCEQVLAANNVITDNGSRGVTIERGSILCTLQGNTIQGSGREGLWIPDCRQCTVTGNLFIKNGRKPNTPKQTWNANITINEAAGSDKSNQWELGCRDYLIAHNTIETDPSQAAAIHITSSPRLSNIIIKDNLLLGENRRILLTGDTTAEVRLTGNNEQP